MGGTWQWMVPGGGWYLLEDGTPVLHPPTVCVRLKIVCPCGIQTLTSLV